MLGMTDILKTDAVEAEFLTGTADIREAARILAALGPREIVLTHKDGLLVLADGKYHDAPDSSRSSCAAAAAAAIPASARTRRAGSTPTRPRRRAGPRP